MILVNLPMISVDFPIRKLFVIEVDGAGGEWDRSWHLLWKRSATAKHVGHNKPKSTDNMLKQPIDIWYNPSTGIESPCWEMRRFPKSLGYPENRPNFFDLDVVLKRMVIWRSILRSPCVDITKQLWEIVFVFQQPVYWVKSWSISHLSKIWVSSWLIVLYLKKKEKTL